MGFFSAIAGPALGLVGDLLGIEGQKAANAANAREAAKQREWEKMMSDTAVFRRTEDLKRSGFNPMLAFMGSNVGGIQATTPPGASAAGTQQNVMANAGSKMMMAVQAANVQSSTAVNLAEARKKNVEADIAEDTKGETAEGVRWTARQAESMFNKLEHESHVLESMEKIRAGEIELNRMEIEELKPLVIKFQALQNRVLESGLEGQELMAEIYKEHPKLKYLEVARKLIFGESSAVRPVGPR